MKPHFLTEDQWYTVNNGRFKGQTGKAFSPGQECHALWFPQINEKISFLGRFEHLRLATDCEKLHVLGSDPLALSAFHVEQFAQHRH